MSYVNDNLMPNEKVLFSAQFHPAIFLPAVVSFLFTILIGIFAFSPAGQTCSADSNPFHGFHYVFMPFRAAFIYSIVLGLQGIIIMFTTEFAVTNRRVVAKTGFIRRHTLEMLLTKIESVAVNRIFLGRMLNFGVVTVTGTGGEGMFSGDWEPFVVRKKISQIIEQYGQSNAPQQGGMNVGVGG